MSATVTVTLHDEHTAQAVFPYNPAIVAWLKEQGGCRWEPELRLWLVPLGHVRRLCEAFQVDAAEDVAATVEAHEEWQATNVVRPYVQGGGHLMHLDTATGRVWLTGPIVDEQPEWFAKMLAPYAPALARIMRRQMAERVTSDNSQLSQANEVTA